jgi:hypothetical protein
MQVELALVDDIGSINFFSSFLSKNFCMMVGFIPNHGH